MGYHRAGFDVTGVDLVRQPAYPFEFVLADALTFDLTGYDAIGASPPCKAHTVARHGGRPKQGSMFEPHRDLLTPMLARLAGVTIPWAVENVPGSPMPSNAITLCGSMFGLRVRRHRLFASNVALEPPPCRHAEQGPVVGVYGTGGADPNRANRPGSGGGVKVAGADAAVALGIDWTDYQPGLSQAIPPAYTEWIGDRLMAALKAAA